MSADASPVDADARLYAYEDEDYVPYVPLKKRRQETKDRLHLRARGVLPHDDPRDASASPPRRAPTLMEEARKLQEEQMQHTRKTDAEILAEEEARILEAHTTRKKLRSHAELAHGIQYTEPIRRSWRPPAFVRTQSEREQERVRKKYHIRVEGVHVPPIITNFRDMKVPSCIMAYLREKHIETPSPIQMQGLPAAFSGRDMIGIASTGSGKTLTFSLPLLLFAVEAEHRLAYTGDDGPVGLIVCPSRELARQTCDSIEAMATVMEQDGYASIRTLLCIGGISMADQAHKLRQGIHIVVATPGRLQDMLQHKRFHLANCTYLCLDEADRMIDMGFEEDMRNIMSFFTQQRQTLLFSATMPKKILDFAEQSLIQPVVVHVGRAGAASLDVIQEVEYVPKEAKMMHLLETLQKTAPPVIIFSDNKHEVDDIYEFLLRKGVEAVAIHGSKTQDEREFAIQSFKEGRKDVMVASGVASKGLDFQAIQHVINFSMPKEIEDYVHQIGRTGRSGKTGVATTFVNTHIPEQTLLDLKYLLMEAKQSIPSFLASLQDPRADHGTTRISCAVCGGLGHSVTQCPKLEDHQRRHAAQFTRGDGDSGF